MNTKIEYTLKKIHKEVSLSQYIEEYVNVNQFLKYCEECPNYNKVWSCPTFDFDPYEIWNAYTRIYIYGYQIKYKGDRTYDEMTEVLWNVKKKVTEELFELEKEFTGSISLSAGSCQLCDKCTKTEGAPCKHPDEMRYSIEALGGDVGRTISRLCGVEIEWVEEGKLPDHFVLVGALLKNK